MIPFISTGDLGELLGRNVTGEQLAIIAIDSSCQDVRSYIGQRLNYVKDDVITLNGNCANTLLLRELPVEDVTAVIEDGVALTTDDFKSTVSGVLYRIGAYWPVGIRNIEVTYSHGYAANEDDVAAGIERMPSDIRRIALSLAQRIYVSSGTVIGTKASESIAPDAYSYTLLTSSGGGGAVSGSSEMTDDEQAILDRYRGVRIG